MSKIQVLDQNTINQIAAGEVIDRPASIVKELLENAIDAGATMVSVEIKDGGMSLIRITDNGSGFDKEDIRVAFLRHATSKIKSALDLITVSSLGFRGEALSSIAAVCQVELITKTEDEVTGVRYKIEGGKEISYEEIGTAIGTTFFARNIFYNTPARRKFLKSPQVEAGYIYDIVEKIALSNPNIAINFISNGQTKIHTSGNGNLKDCIYSIYGREITNNLLEVTAGNDLIKISGYIGKAVIARGNRNNETYFINGRYIKSNIISKAIEDGYKFILMQHKYPFTVLNFEIDSDLLDVNVHPAKMELRFRKTEAIYPLIVDAINDALIDKPNILDVALEEEQKIIQSKINIIEPFEVKRQEINQVNGLLGDTDEDIISDTSVEIIANTEGEIEVNNQVSSSYKSITENNTLEETTEYKSIQKEITEEYEPFLSDLAKPKHKLIGQVFDTYWIIQYEDKMYIIDQHAAHEKVMFEKLMNKLKNKEVNTQMINPPIVLSLSMNEAALLEKYLTNFKEIGFEIESFGGQDYAVRGIPADLYSLDSNDVLMDIVDNLSHENGRMVTDIITEKIVSMSCKAAVKGNSSMSFAEANALIEQLLQLENPYNCPHGRPTIISMSKYELEKKFKRII